MKYIIAITDNQYLLWQVLVQQANFNKWGVGKDVTYLVNVGKNGVLSKNICRFDAHPSIESSFEYFQDTREQRAYIPSIRFDLFRKYFEKYPEKRQERFMYLDPDVLFLSEPNFDSLAATKSWKFSNTDSYMGANYLHSRDNSLQTMASLVGINVEDIEGMTAGGAQSLIDGASSEFWEKCYNDSEVLFTHLIEENKSIEQPKRIQAWCADMWVLLWNALLANKEPEISPLLDFTWATDPKSSTDKNVLFHNAGMIVGDGIFKKSGFMYSSPFKKRLLPAENMSEVYVDAIRYTEKQFPDLIW